LILRVLSKGTLKTRLKHDRWSPTQTPHSSVAFIIFLTNHFFFVCDFKSYFYSQRIILRLVYKSTTLFHDFLLKRDCLLLKFWCSMTHRNWIKL
jgi:hypothetical protein